MATKNPKYCCLCGNGPRRTPHKLLLNVPQGERRKEWAQAIEDALGRKYLNPNATTCLYCCEDHFDLERDTANLLKFKLMGTRLILKKGVVPHRFDGMVKRFTQLSPESKRRHYENGSDVEQHQEIEFVNCADVKSEFKTEPEWDCIP